MPNPLRNPHVKAAGTVAVIIIGNLLLWLALRHFVHADKGTVQWFSYACAFLGAACGFVGASTLFASEGSEQDTVDVADGAEVGELLDSNPELIQPMTRADARELRDKLDRQGAAQKALAVHAKARDRWSLAGWTLIGAGAGLSFFTHWFWTC